MGHPNKSSYDRATFLGKFFISYVYPVLFRALRNKGLVLEDLGTCPKDDRVEASVCRLARNWNRDKKGKNPKLWWTLIRTFGTDFIWPLVVMTFLELFLRIVQQLCLGIMIQYFSNDKDITFEYACYSGLVLCLSSTMYFALIHPVLVFTHRYGMRIRVACCSLMYQKALRLNQASLGQTTVGQIVNIMSNDVNRFDEVCVLFSTLHIHIHSNLGKVTWVQFCPYLLLGPIQTVVVVYIIWTYLGFASLFGLALLLLLIPFQTMMGKLFSRVRSKTAPLTDTRLRFMHEIVSGMRVIKMYCWEKPFASRVAETRKSEVNQIRKACNLKTVNNSTYFIASRIILFASFVTYVLAGNILTSEAVFVSMGLFAIVRNIMTLVFPQLVSQAAELKITCKRIQNFLLLDEFQSNNSPNLADDLDENGNPVFSGDFPEIPDSLVDTNGTEKLTRYNGNFTKPSRLVMDNVCAKWSPDFSQPTLQDISLQLESGDLLAVIGPVGSGKSSVLMTLLGELPVSSGYIKMDGRMSYSNQESWIFNDTVFNNVLFGLDYDPIRYRKVIDACALERDLELMPFGDQTLVGEKGVQLSGGQKARISLARAVYRRADIYLLDDPLSAVDATVAEHIFEKCIVDHLDSKIRILVTHQIQFIQKATKILVLKDGQSVAFGSYDQLRHLGIDFMSLVTSENEDETPEDRPNPEEEKLQEKLSSKILNSPSKTKINKVGQTTKELIQRGSIQSQVYMEYLRAGSSCILLTTMALFTLLSQTLFHGTDIFLTIWTNKNQLEGAKDDEMRDILIYTGLIAALFITTTVRSISIFSICMRASETLHNQIFSRLLRTPVAFFDSTPNGQILNRFSKDLGMVDETLPTTVSNLNQYLGAVTWRQAFGEEIMEHYLRNVVSVIQMVAEVFGLVITVCLVNWYLAWPGLALGIIIYFIRKLYIISARDIKRLEGTARSPVYSHLNTTINGLTTIRAFGLQRQFLRQFTTHQNLHNGTWFMFITSARAIGLLVEWICSMYLSVVTAVVLLIGDLPGGSAGLVLSSSMMLLGVTQWALKNTTDFESQMTSVERIVEYQNLDQEAPAESNPNSKPNKKWPTKGKIQFKNLSLSYGNNNEPMVLKNLNCKIGGGEKIGIVGRTGAGKSSLVAALFRLTEPRGVVKIDGVDIQSIGLDDLRQKISIIPQDPVIYSGTIRYNLDPFNQYSDRELWTVLDQVELKIKVRSFAGKLDAQLSESGGNLSVGQRQLICLARAILRRNRILVLDEATANIDHQTDNLIQETIRTQFVQCTVLTIAHRLNTIIDSDRVLVLDAGEIVEFDIPYLLLQRQGAFYDMCQKTGPKMYAHLLQLAKSTYESRSQDSVSVSSVTSSHKSE